MFLGNLSAIMLRMTIDGFYTNGFEYLQAKGLTIKRTVNVLVSLGANKITAERDIADIIKLSAAINKLRKLSATAAKMAQISIKTLKNKYSEVDWIMLVDSRVLKSNTTPSITENTIIHLMDEGFLEKLMALLQSTNPRAVANLVALDVLTNGIHAILPNETSFLSFTSFPVKEVLRTERSELYFGRLVAPLYVRNALDKKTKTKAQDVVDLSIKEMKLLLSDVQWMDNVTRQKAMQKADEMRSVIGYEDEILDSTKMSEFYDPILEKMDSRSLVNNQVLLFLTSFSKM